MVIVALVAIALVFAVIYFVRNPKNINLEEEEHFIPEPLPGPVYGKTKWRGCFLMFFFFISFLLNSFRRLLRYHLMCVKYILRVLSIIFLPQTTPIHQINNNTFPNKHSFLQPSLTTEIFYFRFWKKGSKQAKQTTEPHFIQRITTQYTKRYTRWNNICYDEFTKKEKRRETEQKRSRHFHQAKGKTKDNMSHKSISPKTLSWRFSGIFQKKAAEGVSKSSPTAPPLLLLLLPKGELRANGLWARSGGEKESKSKGETVGENGGGALMGLLGFVWMRVEDEEVIAAHSREKSEQDRRAGDLGFRKMENISRETSDFSLINEPKVRWKKIISRKCEKRENWDLPSQLSLTGRGVIMAGEEVFNRGEWGVDIRLTSFFCGLLEIKGEEEKRHEKEFQRGEKEPKQHKTKNHLWSLPIH